MEALNEKKNHQRNLVHQTSACEVLVEDTDSDYVTTGLINVLFCQRANRLSLASKHLSRPLIVQIIICREICWI